ncbi:hypothetical protein Tco_0122233 [Tanacetum coccineum]
MKPLIEVFIKLPSTALTFTSSCMDKSKITRKQSKASKHGHENQKSTKRSQRSKAEARKVKPQSNPQPSSQPKDDTYEKVVHESSSTTNSEQTESGTEVAAPKGEKEQDEVASSTVTSGVGIFVHTEDQARSDPGKAHEALAGPDPEPI